VPNIRVVFYQEKPGDIPVLDWIKETERTHCGCSVKFRAYIERLQEIGQLSPPTSKKLRDNIYELRPTYKNRAYRILYFFHSGNAVLCNALLKREDSRREFEQAIDKALERRTKYIEAPSQYTYEEEV
jgi:hypothetical protein